MPTFTSGNDTYTISAAGTYDLDMLGGDDRLNVYGGTTVTAHLGDGNDFAVLTAALDTIFGDAGADRFDIYASNATVDGGADDDSINIRGGSGLTASGGLGDDRFNFIVDTSSISIDGGDGNDAFVGYYHSITGNIMGGAGNDSFVQFVGGVNLYGGLGKDTYQIGVTSAAAIFENPNEGNDTVQVARGYSYILLDNFENLVVASLAGSTLSAATLTGNELANYITAGNNDDTINGLGGNDHLSGKGGNDTIDGGNGNDLVDGGAGNDTLIGGAGNDTLVGRTGDDTMSGGTGNDIYYVDSLSDVVTENLGEGTDTVRVAVDGYTLAINVENGIVQVATGLSLTGNGLNNILTGNAGNDTLTGGAGNDILKGGSGDDAMSGGVGDDTYYVDGPGDAVTENAGEGTDTIHFASSGFTLPNFVENGAVLSGNLYGNNSDNILSADGTLGVGLYGGGGNDTLIGSSASDVLDGYSGTDTAIGGNGNDQYWVDSASDVIIENSGEGYDVVYLTGTAYALADNVEEARSTIYNDSLNITLTGNNGANTLVTGSGADNVSGGGGNDTISSGAGADTIDGGTGDDTLYGGYDGDTIYGGDGNDAIFGYADSYDSGFGNDFNNVLYGGNGDDVLTGGRHTDTLYGESGNDILYGDSPYNDFGLADTLNGGDDNDILVGGYAADTLSGGNGADTFDFNAVVESAAGAGSSDFITDFTSGSDKIDVSTIDANSGVAGDQAFTWTLFSTGNAGQWWFSADGSTPNLYHLFFDVDGGGADMKIDVLTTGGGIATTDITG